MYIVFKGLDEWFKRSGLETRLKNTEREIIKAIQDYILNISNFIIKKTGRQIEVLVSENLLKQALIDAYDDLKRLTNYHFTDDPNPIKEMSYIVFWLIRRKVIVLKTEDIVYDDNLTDIAKVRMIFLNEAFCVNLLLAAAFPKQVSRKNCSDLFENGIRQLKYYKRYLLYYLVYRMDSPKSLEAEVLALTVDPIYEVDPVIWASPIDPSEDF